MYTVAEMHKVVVTLVVASLIVVVAVLSRVTSDSTATGRWLVFSRAAGVLSHAPRLLAKAAV